MKICEILEDVSSFANYIKNKYNLQDFFLFDRGGVIKLDMFVVPKLERKKGVGTAVMNELVDYADKNNKRVILTPGLRDSLHGTTSRGRLVKFYKRFGFVENKGRNKNFTISAGMYREPK